MRSALITVRGSLGGEQTGERGGELGGILTLREQQLPEGVVLLVATRGEKWIEGLHSGLAGEVHSVARRCVGWGVFLLNNAEHIWRSAGEGWLGKTGNGEAFSTRVLTIELGS